MTVTLDQAREAKEELKSVFNRFTGLVNGIGIGHVQATTEQPGGYGVAVNLLRVPDATESRQLPKVYTTKSNVVVGIQYQVIGPVVAF